MSRNDHYVSQTYLRAFTDRAGDIVPYYKNAHTLVGRSKKPKSICFETEGDRSKYLRNPRSLDQYLPAYENRWKSNVADIENGQLTPNARFELCGYIAYLRASSPTAKRLGQRMIAGMAEPVTYQVMMQDLKKNTDLSIELKSRLTKAVQGGQIRMIVNREFAHAQNLAALIGILSRLYCSDWLVMINDSDTLFVTSDNPAIHYRANSAQRIAYTYVPLTPRTAVLISPDLSIGRSDLDAVKNYDCTGKSTFGVIKPSYIMRFNEAIVKNAENMVLHQEKAEWLEKLVRRFRHWRAEAIISHFPAKGGVFTLTSVRAVDTSKSGMSGDGDRLFKSEADECP